MGDYFRPEEQHKARKQHRCTGCLHPIAIGEQYTSQSGYYDGSAFHNKFHAECWDELRAAGDDAFIPGDLEPPERLRHVGVDGHAAYQVERKPGNHPATDDGIRP